jgi:hypothetical protein
LHGLLEKPFAEDDDRAPQRGLLRLLRAPPQIRPIGDADRILLQRLPSSYLQLTDEANSRRI